MIDLTHLSGDPVTIDLSFVRSIVECPSGTVITPLDDEPCVYVKETIHEIAMKAKHNA